MPHHLLAMSSHSIFLPLYKEGLPQKHTRYYVVFSTALPTPWITNDYLPQGMKTYSAHVILSKGLLKPPFLFIYCRYFLPLFFDAAPFAALV
mmetsp:Transcript_10537/g.16339  ORF Transcript_10537/g.16339 Transcript_10537/m.16339 type:complete len:92 (+) Transcript_10537:66-341(+)